MSTVAWRRVLLALCALALIQFGVAAWMESSFPFIIPGLSSGGFVTGIATETATNTPFVHRLSVPPSSPAYHAGLRTGDLVDLRSLTAGERYRWFTRWWWSRDRLQLTVVRADHVKQVFLTTQRYQATWDMWVSIAGSLWMLLFATLIAWLRADSREARVLALLLVLFQIGSTFQPQNWITPWPAVDAAAYALSGILFCGGLALLATYAMIFASPATLIRRILAWLSYAAAGVAALYNIAWVAGTWTLMADPLQAWYSAPLANVITNVSPFFLPLLCVAATIAQTRGAERARIAWASASLAPLYALWSAFVALVAFDPGLNLRLLLDSANIAVFLAPLGLTYSLFNRRLLDIGFAINRAVVFSVVSVVLVGAFVLVEWVLSEWFSSANHTTNLAVSAGLALVLGLSIRFIHARVDHTVGNVFFRKRHEDEQALRNFAREAAYITQPATLLQRTVATLEHHADASFVTIALDDGQGRYGDFDENDPAIVSLRASHQTLDLHTVETALNGDLAYPMAARGRLVGVLMLGPRRSGESYAPDESEAIAQLAHGVGTALDILALKGNSLRETILEAIRALSGEIRSLPDAIVEQLRANDAPS